jgi:hypothetical protein
VSRAFDVAWFFHCAPSTVLALPVLTFLEWERQAYRIKAALLAARE